MTRQEQIDEMAKIVDEMYNVYTTTADDIAEGIYNAGYRKTFTSDLASDTQKAYKEGYEKAQSELKTEIERLKAENACLLKACEGQFTLGTTQNRTYSIFNSVRKDFAEKVKGKSEMFLVAKGDGVYGEKPYVSIEKIDELLKEYE